MRFERVTVDPDRMGGLPCIRGLRIPVATVVGMVAEGMTAEQLLADYPQPRAGGHQRSSAVRGRYRPRTRLPLRRGA